MATQGERLRISRTGVKLTQLTTKTKRERMQCLRRRADHLAERIYQDDRECGFDNQEYAALLWALYELNRHVFLAPSPSAGAAQETEK